MRKFGWILLLAALLLGVVSGAVFAEGAAQEIVPLEIKEEDLDLENGSFCLQIEDRDRIIPEGYFTAALYLEDRYDPAQIESMKAGDRVLVNGEWFTVSEVVIHEDEVFDGADENGSTETDETSLKRRICIYEIYTEEEFWGYITFEPRTEGFYNAVENDWNPITLVKKVKIMLPLADAFVYHEMSSGGAEDDPCGPEDFIDFLLHPEGDEEEDEANAAVPFFNPYNTNVGFRDGLMMNIWSFSYPHGPEIDE